MKTGDASAEFWRHGLRHLYCCEVTSERGTPEGRVRYFWRVAMICESLIGEGSLVHQTKFKPCRTFADGLRLASRMADYLERKRMELDKKGKR